MTDGDIDSKKKFNDKVANNLERAGLKMIENVFLICMFSLDSLLSRGDWDPNTCYRGCCHLHHHRSSLLSRNYVKYGDKKKIWCFFRRL